MEQTPKRSIAKLLTKGFMNANRLLIFFLPVVLLSSCGLFRRATSDDFTNLRNKSKFISSYSRLIESQQYDWYVASGRLKIKSEKQNVSLGVSLKSREDSLVWLRLTKLLELARAQLDRGNFDLINRLDRSHTSFTYQDIATYIDPDQGMAAVQSVLMGNVPFDIRKADFEIGTEFYELSIEDSISQKAFLDKKTLKLRQYEITSKKEQTTAVANFGDYEQVTEHMLIPKSINVEIVGAELESISIEFSKIGFSKKEQVEFEIPNGYKKN